MVLPKKALLALLPFFLQIQETASQASGSGVTTRYWDCCKPSCSWTKKISLASGYNPVQSCDINDSPLSNYDAKSGCDGGGPSYMCSNQTPWAINDNLAYGFAAVSISGGTEASWCCACYELTFTSGPVSGKKMVVQATNTGGDLGNNHFDLAMPGGGFGIFNGCTAQYGTPSTGWGQQYGGVSSRSQCDAFNPKIRDGCYWRFDWFQNADNPSMTFKQVSCPAALIAKTGCLRQGESIAPDSSATATSKTTTPAASSTTTPAVQTTTPVRPTTTTTPAVGTTTSTTASRAPTTSSTTTPGGSGETAPKWGQCGGQGWTGPTTCAAGSTCTFSNSWYSQCL